MPGRLDIVEVHHHSPRVRAHLIDIRRAPEMLDECGFVALAREKSVDLSFKARETVDQRRPISRQPRYIAQDARQRALGMKWQFDNIGTIQPAGRNGGHRIRRSRLAKKDSMHGKSLRQILEYGCGPNGAPSNNWIRRFCGQEQRSRFGSQRLTSGSAGWRDHTRLW